MFKIYLTRQFMEGNRNIQHRNVQQQIELYHNITQKIKGNKYYRVLLSEAYISNLAMCQSLLRVFLSINTYRRILLSGACVSNLVFFLKHSY